MQHAQLSRSFPCRKSDGSSNMGGRRLSYRHAFAKPRFTRFATEPGKLNALEYEPVRHCLLARFRDSFLNRRGALMHLLDLILTA